MTDIITVAALNCLAAIFSGSIVGFSLHCYIRKQRSDDEAKAIVFSYLLLKDNSGIIITADTKSNYPSPIIGFKELKIFAVKNISTGNPANFKPFYIDQNGLRTPTINIRANYGDKIRILFRYKHSAKMEYSLELFNPTSTY